MSHALYRQWRPQVWEEVVGQDHVVQTLRHAVAAERVAHAYLFSGPRGTGKTTTARLLAKAVNCLAESPADRPCNRCGHCQAVREGRFLDLIEIDAASNTSVEDVRDLRDRINFSPNAGRYKVYIVDEVHMLSTAAFNALLKTLEEPPAHAIFVLATTEVHRVPATVLSRCQRHEFRRLPLKTIVEYLERKAAEAGLRADAGALELIARHSTGSLRDAISLLDQLSALEPPLTAGQVRAVLGRASDSAVWEVVKAWADGDAARGLQSIQTALEGGADARPFARQVVEGLRDVLLVQVGNQALPERSAEEVELVSRLSSKATRSALLTALRSFGRAASEGRASWQPALALELALLESLAEAGLPTPSGPAPRADAPPSAGSGTSGSLRRPVPGPSKPRAEDKPAVRETRATLPAIQEIIERWPEVLKAAYGRDPKTQALLNSCRPLGMDSGVLLLGFQSDLLREKMERSPSLSVAGEALQQVFETLLRVRCVLTSRWQEGKSAPQESRSLDDAGMVATAVRDFGAQVVGIEPLPPDSPA